MTDLLTLAEVADTLRVSLRSVHRLIAGDDLPSVRIGRRRLVRRSTLATYLAAREAAVG